MSQSEKSLLYKELKDAGVTFDKHYRDYNTAELRESVNVLRQHTGKPLIGEEIPQEFEMPKPQPREEQAGVRIPPPRRPEPRPAPRDEHAGLRLNTKHWDEPLRIDEDGTIWFQTEVTKPAYPKPRGRRVLKYNNTGSVQKTVVNGQYTETFEVAGSREEVGEVKITLPSYQVGLRKDPRFPFRIHSYNGNEGFNLIDVQKFYGAAELVPPECKRKYVENVLCYDIRSVVRAINNEYRQQTLSRMKG